MMSLTYSLRCFLTRRFFFFACLVVLASSARAEVDHAPSVVVFVDKTALGEAVAAKIVALIQKNNEKNRATVLGLATGSTPIPVYAALRRLVAEQSLNLSRVVAFNLDEYVGLTHDHPQTYRRFMWEQLWQHVGQSRKRPNGIRPENIHIPDGTVSAMQVNAGEGAFAAASHFHNIQNAGDETVQVMAFFTNADPDYIGLGEVIGAYSNEILASIFNVAPTYFDPLVKPTGPLVIVPVT